MDDGVFVLILMSPMLIGYSLIAIFSIIWWPKNPEKTHQMDLIDKR